MSFITQCPACETQFKVAPDQLKISEGWVRCGQCQHVFDASLNLQPWFPEPDPQPQPFSPPSAHPEESTSTSEPVQTLPNPEEPQVQDVPDDLREPRFDLDRDVQATQATHSTEPTLANTSGHQDPGGPEPKSRDEQPHPDNPVSEPYFAADSAMPALGQTSEPVPSFIQKAMEKAYWHRTSVRVAMYLLICILLLLLGAQWFYRHKNELAVNQPQLRPALQAVCAVLGCHIEVPRKLSEVVIDSSSFVRGQANRFDFQLILRNRAESEVAMPTLELTLTDIENQVIARRIIPPSEWPNQPTSLSAQATWALQLELSLDVPPTQIVTGYQAELFYP